MNNNNPQSYDNILQQYIDTLNKNYNQNLGNAQQKHDLTTTNLNTLNTQALGVQDPNAQSAFLNSVYTPDMKNQGSIEYGYNMNLGNENAVYGLQNTANSQNRKMALDKLANDEKYALAGLGLKQGNQNAATLDSLNSRGLLYGQAPTGGFSPNAMGGMNGFAAQQSGLVNQDFNNQRGQLTGGYDLNVGGTNNQYNQLQASQDQQHNYNVKNLGYNAANDVNSQNANYTYQTGMANNQLQAYKNTAGQQLYNDQQSADQIAKKQGAQQNGITYQ